MSTLLIALTGLAVAQEPAPKDWAAWARWAEKIHPVTDGQGHGPDIGSDEWANALAERLGVSDADGHELDLKSDEWRAAVEKKLKPQRERDLLSAHDTVAVFKGLRDHTCMGRTALCPDRCGESGKLATFEIVKYLNYEKPGEYGDPKQERFIILIEDNMGNAKVPAANRAAILALEPGDQVHLKWNHDYIIREGSRFPERPIQELSAIKPEAGQSKGNGFRDAPAMSLGNQGNPSEADIAALRRVIRDQEDKVGEIKKVLDTITRTKGIIHKGGMDVEERASSSDEEKSKEEDAEKRYCEITREIWDLELSIACLRYLEEDRLVERAAAMQVANNPVREIYPEYLRSKRTHDEVMRSVLELNVILESELKNAMERLREADHPRAIYVAPQTHLSIEQEILDLMREKLSRMTNSSTNRHENDPAE